MVLDKALIYIGEFCPTRTIGLVYLYAASEGMVGWLQASLGRRIKNLLTTSGRSSV
ncbi:hypothetical protein GGR38_002992 [Novosphingobium sediminicola]|uniref:Uncharacterized protein n=1 Tax=Novosphingobium sediminicola TaxID=563162 RepID=A0A7W6G7C8_9SPHN|nr:hypothetical protein [Novosphingobium sediminicola]